MGQRELLLFDLLTDRLFGVKQLVQCSQWKHTEKMLESSNNMLVTEQLCVCVWNKLMDGIEESRNSLPDN